MLSFQHPDLYVAVATVFVAAATHLETGDRLLREHLQLVRRIRTIDDQTSGVPRLWTVVILGAYFPVGHTDFFGNPPHIFTAFN